MGVSYLFVGHSNRTRIKSDSQTAGLNAKKTKPDVEIQGSISADPETEEKLIFPASEALQIRIHHHPSGGAAANNTIRGGFYRRRALSGHISGAP